MDDEPEKTYPVSPAKMSKVPSWISVGFLLGMIAGWGLHPDAEPPPAAPAVGRVLPAVVTPTKLTTIEAVFAKWGSYAVWTEGDHTTEIAFWSFDAHEYSEYYEVKRLGDELFFRSIPRLTRTLIDYGERLPADCPLRFTAPWRPVAERETFFQRDSPAPPPAPPAARIEAVPTQKIEPPAPEERVDLDALPAEPPSKPTR